MAIDISKTFVALLAGNRGPDLNGSEGRRVYGITATLAADSIDLVLTFRRPNGYCCMEWGCHLGLHDGERWLGLRQALLADGISAPDQLRLWLRCIVEEGAMFYDFSRPDPNQRGVYAFKPAAAYSYEVSTSEAAKTE
jgi:hypothetical protein